MSRESRPILFLVVFTFVLLSLLPAGAQIGSAQAGPPLSFGNNFFVTGDYIVAGAYGMTSNFTTINGIGYAVGTITVPDGNPGITGATQVPKGAQIVTALLYWQTVEKVGVVAGGPGSGQNGYFRPLLYAKTGGPAAPGYAISGTNVTGANAVSWSSGGCTGSSTGKLLQTYRADVSGALPLDATGNPTANGSFEVRLPSVGSSAPLTLGATLVVIYRIPAGAEGPNVPLNSIVIYDGDYSQTNSQLTMTQQLQGFYDAATNPVSRLTHIVSDGKVNKYQTVYLGSNNNSPVALPSLYGRTLPAFPGYYGTWDNPTWTFSGAGNPVVAGASSVTTKVVPSMSNQGCVSWGAVIVSTTVQNSDNDGILDSWKLNNPSGYCDASINNGVCSEGNSEDPGWVPLPGAMQHQKDLFLQYDYMCNAVSSASCSTTGGNYSFDPRLAVDPADNVDAVDKVVAAYASHKITLHAIPGNPILEGQTNISCAANDSTCVFPNEPGTVGFREGLTFIKNQTIDTQSGVLGCTTNTDPNCVPVFQHGKKDSYHYALFSHGVGLPNWFLSDGSLVSVKQAKNTVTFTTNVPHGIRQITPATGATAPDTMCTLGRVTVIFAATNPALNGTFCVLSSPAPTATTFAISVGGSPTTATYTSKTDPNLSVGNGQVTSMSGYSDVGGQGSVISLGEGGWGPATNPTSDGNKWQVKAGTFMHELGHTMGLTHGGTWYNKLGNKDYTPTLEANCKPNVQSIMSYSFQVDLLQTNELNSLGQPLMVVDYSGQALPTLTKSLPEAGILRSADYATTTWFQLISSSFGPPLVLTSVANASSGSTVYTGTITGGGGNAFAGMTFTVTGFANPANNGTFTATASTTTTLTLSNAAGVGAADAGMASPAGVSPHCDGTPLLPTDKPMSSVTQQPVGSFSWSSTTGEDINFDGNTTDVLHGHDEWDGTPGDGEVGPTPGLDFQQVSALGTTTTSGLGGESGLGHPGGGGLGHPGGGGLGHPGGGGLGHPGGGGISDVTHETANSYTRPPSGVTATEAVSARTITLNWFQPTFGQIVQYNVYRAVGGGPFSLLSSVFPTPPATTFPPTTYTDNPSCNPGGYSYKVTAFVLNDVTGQPQESAASNIVSVPDGQDPLTGCYVITNFTTPASGVQGNLFPITWTLNDDFYATDGKVTNPNASSLAVNGPLPGNCSVSGTTNVLTAGTPNPTYGAYTQNGNVFTYTLNTDPFCAGTYTFTLTLDSQQPQPNTPSLQLNIDVNDQDNPNITTVALPSGTVGLAYPAYTLTEEGGVPLFKWTVGGLPTGILQQSQFSPIISGTTCSASPAGSPFQVGVSVTDSKGNTGSQGFSLQISKANTTTGIMSSANASFFQQSVTFTVTVASLPASTCALTGTVTLYDGGVAIASNLPVSGGMATFTTSTLSVGNHNITASYSNDPNFNSSNGTLSPSQVVNPAMTATSISSQLPATVFVGQPVTVSYTFGVVAPGGGSPIAPTGNITVAASDGSGCVVPVSLSGGMCTLSPTPQAAGNVTYTANYTPALLDHNFVASGANSNYNVYQLVFTTQPSNTAPGATITPPVQVTAEDSSNTILTSFAGAITLAIGSGPAATLSGTIPQTAVNGVATFPDLSINQVGGYTLKASPDGTVFDAASNAFTVGTATFYIDANGSFGSLNLLSGATTQIGAGTATGATGMDLTPGGQVYAATISDQLVQIAPSTGAATLVGTGSLPNPGYTISGALTNGSYYGLDSQSGILYSIDTTTGATTQVATTTVPLIPANCGFVNSFSGSANTLYYTLGLFSFAPTQGNPNPPPCSAPQNDTLYTIDPTTGTTTAVGQVTINGSGVNEFIGSAFVGGKLYGFTYNPGNPAPYYTIDVTTGVATFVANTSVSIFGAGSSQ